MGWYLKFALVVAVLVMVGLFSQEAYKDINSSRVETLQDELTVKTAKIAKLEESIVNERKAYIANRAKLVALLPSDTAVIESVLGTSKTGQAEVVADTDKKPEAVTEEVKK